MSKRPREAKLKRERVGDLPPRALRTMWKTLQPKWEEVALYCNVMPNEIESEMEKKDRDREKEGLVLLVRLSNRGTLIDDLIEAVKVVFMYNNDVVLRSICMDTCPDWVKDD